MKTEKYNSNNISVALKNTSAVAVAVAVVTSSSMPLLAEVQTQRDDAVDYVYNVDVTNATTSLVFYGGASSASGKQGLFEVIKENDAVCISISSFNNIQKDNYEDDIDMPGHDYVDVILDVTSVERHISNFDIEDFEEA